MLGLTGSDDGCSISWCMLMSRSCRRRRLAKFGASGQALKWNGGASGGLCKLLRMCQRGYESPQRFTFECCNALYCPNGQNAPCLVDFCRVPCFYMWDASLRSLFAAITHAYFISANTRSTSHKMKCCPLVS